ncbi:unnamed protein product [Linum trigynum]|uniref:Uncharacterized protein n=1 Tax=Linum trigynum TaxID=586398 RepID=A0AAV2CEP7_9ROSI
MTPTAYVSTRNGGARIECRWRRRIVTDGITSDLTFFTQQQGVQVFKTDRLHMRLNVTNKGSIILTKAIEEPRDKIMNRVKIVRNRGITTPKILKFLRQMADLKLRSRLINRTRADHAS